jgi:hypothetical protein
LLFLRYIPRILMLPRSTPSYTATYTEASLILRATLKEQDNKILAGCESLLARGYCGLVLDYLREQGPREGRGRASLWGLQRPPLGRLTLLRVEAGDTFDSIAPTLIAFLSTSAANSLRVSVDVGWHHKIELLLKDDQLVVQTASEFEKSCVEENPWNVLRADDDHCKSIRDIPAHLSSPGGAKKASGGANYALAGHFAARLFVMGHVKSTRESDDAFINEFKPSEKWLRCTLNE